MIDDPIKYSCTNCPPQFVLDACLRAGLTDNGKWRSVATHIFPQYGFLCTEYIVPPHKWELRSPNHVLRISRSAGKYLTYGVSYG